MFPPASPLFNTRFKYSRSYPFLTNTSRSKMWKTTFYTRKTTQQIITILYRAEEYEKY